MRLAVPHRTFRFRGLSILESPFVYPVQPEVPEAIELMLRHLQGGSSRRILEIGTGSGIIACAMAAHGHRVLATDILPEALSLARKNAERNNLAMEFADSDLFDRITGRFDTIIFNVPNTLATTRWGTLLQHIGTRLLSKRTLEATSSILARFTAGTTRKKAALLRRLLLRAGDHLTLGGELILLIQRADHEHLRNDRNFTISEVKPLPSSQEVQLITLLRTSGQPADLQAAPSSAH